MIFEDTKELFETQVLENKVKIFGDCVFVIVIVKKYCRCLSTIVIFQVLEYKAKNKRTKETLLTCLADLFYSIVTQKRKVCFTFMNTMTMTMMMNRSFTASMPEFLKVGTIAPKKFIARLRKEKVEFDNYMQQVSID